MANIAIAEEKKKRRVQPIKTTVSVYGKKVVVATSGLKELPKAPKPRTVETKDGPKRKPVTADQMLNYASRVEEVVNHNESLMREHDKKVREVMSVGSRVEKVMKRVEALQKKRKK